MVWLQAGLGLVLGLLAGSRALVQEDRVSALTQVVHAGWKTPWLEMSLSEMPRFMLNEVVLMHPVLPKKDENDRNYQWNPELDAKISFTFSHSKMSIPSIILYSKDGKILEKIVFSFEHDAYDIISVSHSETYKNLDGQGMPDLSKKKYPPIDVEYQWNSVQEEDLNLGVKIMFITTILLFTGLAWVILMSYDRDSQNNSPSNRRSASASRGRIGSGSGGGAGITVNKRR